MGLQNVNDVDYVNESLVISIIALKVSAKETLVITVPKIGSSRAINAILSFQIRISVGFSPYFSGRYFTE